MTAETGGFVVEGSTYVVVELLLLLLPPPPPPPLLLVGAATAATVNVDAADTAESCAADIERGTVASWVVEPMLLPPPPPPPPPLVVVWLALPLPPTAVSLRQELATAEALAYSPCANNTTLSLARSSRLAERASRMHSGTCKISRGDNDDDDDAVCSS